MTLALFATYECNDRRRRAKCATCAGGGGGLKVVPIGFIHENEHGVQFQAIDAEPKRRK